jgi:BirA family biotin operon repressor/biotin-[acetyl-CoA-carboxylase] ligase
MADRQTRGRGSKGRSWESGRDRHLFCSLVIHARLEAEIFSAMTLFTGLSVFRALKGLGTEGLSIKWPNDILIRNRKVCGILCESRDIGPIRAVVAGIGINISGSRRQFPEHLQKNLPTLAEHGIEPGRLELLNRIAREMDGILHQILAPGHGNASAASIFRQWEAASSSIGRQVEFKDGNRPAKGTIIGIDDHGRLLVMTDRGTPSTVLSGSVHYL